VTKTSLSSKAAIEDRGAVPATPRQGRVPQRGRWPHRAKLVVFSVLPAVILLAAAEVAAHLVTHRTLAYTLNEFTQQTEYRLRTGRLPWSPVSVTRLNSLGLPDDEFVNVLPKGECIHVVFAGDSFVFGDAVDRDRSFFSLVSHASAFRNSDRCIRFFNVAQQGTTIYEQRQRIEETLPLLEPDLIVIGQYQNDLTDLTNPGSYLYTAAPADEEPNFWGDRLRMSIPGFNSNLFRLLTYRAFAFMITNDIAYDVLWKWSALEGGNNREYAERLKSAYTQLFAGLVQDLRGRGVEVGVVILPSKMDLLAKRYPEGDFFALLAAAHEIPSVEVFSALMNERRPYAYQMYDGHLSEAGNAVVAREIYAWLFESPDEPFPLLSGR
jgi:hypothetical protein